MSTEPKSSAMRVYGGRHQGRPENGTATMGDAAGDAAMSDTLTVVQVGVSSFAVLALDSDQCLAFHLSASQLKPLKNRGMLVYELEDRVPIDGEYLAIGRIDGKRGGLVLAVDSRELSVTINSMETNDTHVTAIAPIVLLAISQLSRIHEIRKYDILVWQSSHGVDLLWLDQGLPVEWSWTTANAELIAKMIQESKTEIADLSVLMVDTEEVIVDHLSRLFSVASVALDRNEAASVQCEKIVDGTARPLVDLREGPLRPADPYRPIAVPLRAFALTAVMLQVCIVASLWYRATVYRHESTQLVINQEAAYRQVFPNSPLPVGLVNHLQSEHRRLSGTRGLSDQAVPELKSAIPVAHAFLGGLPEDVETRFAIERVEFVPEKVAIATGVAKTYRDLGVIAQRLRDAGFSVPPVSASRTATGVSLRFEDIGLTGAKVER